MFCNEDSRTTQENRYSEIGLFRTLHCQMDSSSGEIQQTEIRYLKHSKVQPSDVTRLVLPFNIQKKIWRVLNAEKVENLSRDNAVGIATGYRARRLRGSEFESR
jgi:hypothetical protein